MALQDCASSVEMVEAIFNYVTQITQEASVQGMIKLLAEMARSITDADRCSVWIVSEDASYLWTLVAHGIEEVRIPYGSGIVGYAVSEQKRLIINDVYADPRFNPDVDQETGYHTRNMMVVPMLTSSGRTIGAFQLVNKLPEGAAFEQEHLKYVMLASTYAAEALSKYLERAE